MYYFLLSAIVFFVYSAICLISLIFTFSVDTYNSIDEKLKLEVFPSPLITPLDKSINIVDNWVLENNKIIGPLLAVLSLVDMKSFFNIIGMMNV
ncbi:MAG TPA: hypothetical protein VMD04_03195 [Candidatus Margulisiibacteriota bacterium]|nr:hypothetical protein [Candidatus Margulisiibacteriota bacterium]